MGSSALVTSVTAQPGWTTGDRGTQVNSRGDLVGHGEHDFGNVRSLASVDGGGGEFGGSKCPRALMRIQKMQVWVKRLMDNKQRTSFPGAVGPAGAHAHVKGFGGGEDAGLQDHLFKVRRLEFGVGVGVCERAKGERGQNHRFCRLAWPLRLVINHGPWGLEVIVCAIWVLDFFESFTIRLF